MISRRGFLGALLALPVVARIAPKLLAQAPAEPLLGMDTPTMLNAGSEFSAMSKALLKKYAAEHFRADQSVFEYRLSFYDAATGLETPVCPPKTS